MDQLICASLSHTYYWYEVGMLKVPAAVPVSLTNVLRAPPADNQVSQHSNRDQLLLKRIDVSGRMSGVQRN